MKKIFLLLLGGLLALTSIHAQVRMDEEVQNLFERTHFKNRGYISGLLVEHPEIGVYALEYKTRGASLRRAWKRAIRHTLRGAERRRALRAVGGTPWYYYLGGAVLATVVSFIPHREGPPKPDPWPVPSYK